MRLITRRGFQLAVVVAGLCLATAPARADIMVTVDNSTVVANLGGGSGSASASYGFGTSPLSISGNGRESLSVSGAPNPATALSLIDLTFTLNGPHTFTLSGLLNVDFEAGPFVADFTLTGPGVNDLFSTTQGSLPFADAGFLPGGTYHLVARAQGNSSGNGFALGNSSYDFTFNVVPGAVPEPASVVVFGLLAGAGVAYRRRTRRVGV